MKEYKTPAEVQIEAQRLKLGLPIIPDKNRGDMDEVARLRRIMDLRAKKIEQMKMTNGEDEPTRSAYSREEMAAQLKNWMVAYYGSPRDYPAHSDTKDRWYRDFGLIYHFICDHFAEQAE